MPPSAISGTPVPLSAVATLSIAMICGTPPPATMPGGQIEPGAMATLTAADQGDLGIVLPAPAHALDHALAVAMGRVDDDGIDAGPDQGLDALFGALAHAHRSA